MVLSASSWNKMGSKRIHMTSVFTLAHWVSVTFTTDFERFLNTLNLPSCYLSDAFTSKKLGFLWHRLILAAFQCRLKLWLVTAWGNWAINVTFYFKITSHNRLLIFFKPLFNHALPAALQWLLSRFEWPIYSSIYSNNSHDVKGDFTISISLYPVCILLLLWYNYCVLFIYPMLICFLDRY